MQHSSENPLIHTHPVPTSRLPRALQPAKPSRRSRPKSQLQRDLIEFDQLTLLLREVTP